MKAALKTNDSRRFRGVHGLRAAIAALCLAAVCAVAIPGLTSCEQEEERTSVTVYAKWEVVALVCDEANRTYTVTGLLAGAGADVVIPETYNGLPVTKIADEAFRGNTTLSSITLSEEILYFCAPKKAPDCWVIRNRPRAFAIGNHTFYY